jgi:hypothetical protein
MLSGHGNQALGGQAWQTCRRTATGPDMRGRNKDGRSISELLCGRGAHLRGRGAVLRHHRDPRHSAHHRQEANQWTLATATLGGKGKVGIVLDAIAAGQLQANGTLQDYGARVPRGRAVALIDLIDDISAYRIPAGSSGEAAIYTDHFHHVSTMRKILLRMRSWRNYIYMAGH